MTPTPPETSTTAVAPREYPGYDPDFDVKAFGDRFLLVGRVLAEPDFIDSMRQFLRVVETAHNVGWFIDPTKYRDMLQREVNMDDLAGLVKLALPLAEAVQELQAKLAPAVPSC